MNNGLGINFFRHLKEEDEHFWIQVFAKLPFDDAEIKQKGSLFGVVKLEKVEGWSELDMEITAWVDDYFNGVDKEINLSDFFSKLREKFKLVDSIWLSIFEENASRKIKAVCCGEASLTVKRGDNIISLAEGLADSKIVSGEIKTGDEITVGVGSSNWKEMKKSDSLPESELVHGFFEIKVESEIEKLETETSKIVNVEDISKVEKVEDTTAILATEMYVGKQTIGSRLKNFFARRYGSLSMSDENLRKKRKRGVFLLGVLFVALLILSLVLGSVKKETKLKEDRWIEFSGPIEKMVDGAVEIAKINPVGAKNMVEEAKQKFLSGKGDYENKEKIDLLEKKIEMSWTLVSGEKKAEFSEVINLELIRSGVNASRIAYSSKDLFSVISSENGTVISVSLGSKEMKVLAGKGAGLGWIDSVISKEKAFVLTKGGVFIAGNESNSLVFDTAVTDPVSMAVFGANLYVLEKGNKEIFKYSVTESGFGERQRWLKEGQSISSTPVDMDIDVDIWVLEHGNTLERFRRGVKESFSLSGISKEIEVEKISVEAEGDRIALLAPKQGTVVLCLKTTGICEKQLKNDKINEARDVVFGESGVLYILLKSSVGMLN